MVCLVLQEGASENETFVITENDTGHQGEGSSTRQIKFWFRSAIPPPNRQVFIRSGMKSVNVLHRTATGSTYNINQLMHLLEAIISIICIKTRKKC